MANKNNDEFPELTFRTLKHRKGLDPMTEEMESLLKEAKRAMHLHRSVKYRHDRTIYDGTMTVMVKTFDAVLKRWFWYTGGSWNRDQVKADFKMAKDILKSDEAEYRIPAQLVIDILSPPENNGKIKFLEPTPEFYIGTPTQPTPTVLCTVCGKTIPCEHVAGLHQLHQGAMVTDPAYDPSSFSSNPYGEEKTLEVRSFADMMCKEYDKLVCPHRISRVEWEDHLCAQEWFNNEFVPCKPPLKNFAPAVRAELQKLIGCGQVAGPLTRFRVFLAASDDYRYITVLDLERLENYWIPSDVHERLKICSVGLKYVGLETPEGRQFYVKTQKCFKQPSLANVRSDTDPFGTIKFKI